MNDLPDRSCEIEIRIPLAKTEQEFLRRAVQAAVKKFREMESELPQPAAAPHNDTLSAPHQGGRP